MYPPPRHLFHYYPDGYSENFSGVIHITRIFYSSFIELISTICLSQPAWLPVSSPPEKKILVSGDASLSLLSLESLAVYLTHSRYLMNIYWMSEHLLQANVVHFLHMYLSHTCRLDTMNPIIPTNYLGLRQVKWLVQSYTACDWWIRTCLSSSKVHVFPSHCLWNRKA